MKRLKKIVKRVFPVFLSLLILSGTIFSNLKVAHATGVVLLFRMLNKNIALLENPPLEEKGVCFN